MFLKVCHLFNSLHLSIVPALMRLVLHMALASFSTEKGYAQPKNVGYLGWVEVPKLGPLAFRNLNGKLQYRW